MTLYIRDAEFRDLVTAEEANDVIEEVFANDAQGLIVNRPSIELPVPGGFLRIKLGSDFSSGSYGLKAYGAPGRFLVVVYSEALGLEAFVEGRQLTELRTGAVSAVATKYMARADASTFGIIGTGLEARQQLVATCLVRDFKTVWCYSRSRQHREDFARDMSAQLGIHVVPVASGEACVRSADVVTTITSSDEPVLEGSWLREGTHINAVGATRPNRRELDVAAIGRCGTVVVELKQGAVSEIGELIDAAAIGLLDWENVRELKEIVGGTTIGRQSASEITLMDTVGLGSEDVALAAFAVKKARDTGAGVELPF